MSQLPAYSSYFLPWDDFASIVNFVSRDTVHTLDRRLITFIIRNWFPSLNEAWSVSLFLSLPLSFFSSLNKFFYNYASYNKKKKELVKRKTCKINSSRILDGNRKIAFYLPFKEKAVERVNRVIGCSSCSKVEKIKNGKSQRIMMIRFRTHFGTAIATAKEMSGACVQNARIHHGSRWGWYRCRRFQRCSWQSSSMCEHQLELLLFLSFFILLYIDYGDDNWQ